MTKHYLPTVNFRKFQPKRKLFCIQIPVGMQRDTRCDAFRHPLHCVQIPVARQRVSERRANNSRKQQKKASGTKYRKPDKQAARQTICADGLQNHEQSRSMGTKRELCHLSVLSKNTVCPNVSPCKPITRQHCHKNLFCNFLS